MTQAEPKKPRNVSWVDAVIVVVLGSVLLFRKDLDDTLCAIIIVGILAIAGIRSYVPGKASAFTFWIPLASAAREIVNRKVE